MSKTKPTNVAMDRVKSYVDRLEKMEEERKAIGGDIRDIYLEAKGNGFDVKTLRWLLSERKVDAAERDERDALVVWLRGRGHDVADSDANFVLFGRFPDRHAVWQGLLDRGVLIRETGPQGWLRVSVGTPEENALMIDALQKSLR